MDPLPTCVTRLLADLPLRADDEIVSVLVSDAGLRVVAWTCPGYGAGEEVPAGYGVPLLAEYAARLVLAEKTRHNILLGHSMGGLIGPRVPALVGDALDGLILSAASPASPTGPRRTRPSTSRNGSSPSRRAATTTRVRCACRPSASSSTRRFSMR